MLKEHHYDAQDQLATWYPFAKWMTEVGLAAAPQTEGAEG